MEHLYGSLFVLVSYLIGASLVFTSRVEKLEVDVKKDAWYYLIWPVALIGVRVIRWLRVRRMAAEEAKFQKIFGFPPIHFLNNEEWAVELARITLEGLALRLHKAFKLQEKMREKGLGDDGDIFSSLVAFQKNAFWKAHEEAMSYGTRNMLRKYTDYLPAFQNK